MTQANLYEQLTERINLSGSERIPRLFQLLADEDDARLMLAMPGTVESLADKMGMSTERVKEMVDLLFLKGLVFESTKPDGVRYRMVRDLIQFHDASILYKDASDEFLELWQDYKENEWPHLAGLMEKGMPRPAVRVIPVDRVIEAGTQVLDFDRAWKMVASAKTLAVTKCPCRLTALKCDSPLEVCMQVDKAAEYAIKRGTGRPLTKEEAFEVLESTEKAGLVHCTMNQSSRGHVLCNCCACCCQFMHPLIRDGKRICDPSRYLAEIDQEACTGCETCVDRCMFNAIEMRRVEGEDKEVSHVIEEKCMGCGLCATSCPEEAISLVEIRPVEFIPESYHKAQG
jgi:ferredoxin